MTGGGSGSRFPATVWCERYACTITAAHEDGSYSVDWGDEASEGVAREDLRRLARLPEHWRRDADDLVKEPAHSTLKVGGARRPVS